MRLFSFERRWLIAILRDLVPGAAEAPLERYLDDLVRHAPLEFLLGLRACVWVVLLSPPLLLGRWCSYLGLSRRERSRLHERLGESSIYLLREMPTMFKMVGCLGYCGLPQVQRRLGIPATRPEPPSWMQSADHEP